MKIVNEFCYKRNYFIRDLSRPNIIFNKCEQLEFDTFESFINNYLAINSMVNLPYFKRLIIPIDSTNQISYLSGIVNNTPTYLFYLKNIDKDIISELKAITTINFGVMVDGSDVIKFKKCLDLMEDKYEVAKVLSRTHGAYRVILDSDNLNDLLDLISEPFTTFPFFNFCDLIIKFHTFEDTKLKDLHQLIYDFKLLNKFISMNLSKTLNWNKYINEVEDIQYKFSLMNRTGKELFIKDGKIMNSFYGLDLPSYDCNLLTQDGNYISKNVLDKFLGATSIEYDENYFVIKDENYLCNSNITSLPYLNRILCNILKTGDI